MSQPPQGAQPHWLWDPDSQKWCWYDARTDRIVSEDGRWIPRPSTIPRTSFTSAGSQAPATSADFAKDSRGYSASPASQFQGQQPQHGSGRRPSNTVDNLAEGVGKIAFQDRPTQAESSNRPYLSEPHEPQITVTGTQRIVSVQDPRSKVHTAFQTTPADAITDPVLFQYGITARRYLYAPDNHASEAFFESYRKRDSPRKFFTLGKVFLVLWVEPMGESVVTNYVPGESLGVYGERVFSKVRRFIVIREGSSYCSCLPIMTYGKRGVGKPGVVKSEHSIVHTSKVPPDPLPEEAPRRDEAGMRPQAVRVDADDPKQKLDEVSRLDYGKIHTIQHNIKVKSFGKVNPKSMNALLHQFGNVWNSLPVVAHLNVHHGQGDASSIGSDKRRSIERRQSHAAQSGKGKDSLGRGEQSTVPRHQRNDSHIEGTVDTQADAVQQRIRAAVRRLTAEGYTEAQALAAVQAEWRRKARGKGNSKEDEEHEDEDEEEEGDDDDVDDEGDEDGDRDDAIDNADNQGEGPSSRHGHSSSSHGATQTQRSAQSQSALSTKSSHQGNIGTSETTHRTAHHVKVSENVQVGPSRTSGYSQSQYQSKSQPTGSRAESTSSILSREQLQAQAKGYMAALLAKGWSEEDAKEEIRKRFSRKGL